MAQSEACSTRWTGAVEGETAQGGVETTHRLGKGYEHSHVSAVATEERQRVNIQDVVQNAEHTALQATGQAHEDASSLNVTFGKSEDGTDGHEQARVSVDQSSGCEGARGDFQTKDSRLSIQTHEHTYNGSSRGNAEAYLHEGADIAQVSVDTYTNEDEHQVQGDIQVHDLGKGTNVSATLTGNNERISAYARINQTLFQKPFAKTIVSTAVRAENVNQGFDIQQDSLHLGVSLPGANDGEAGSVLKREFNVGNLQAYVFANSRGTAGINLTRTTELPGKTMEATLEAGGVEVNADLVDSDCLELLVRKGAIPQKGYIAKSPGGMVASAGVPDGDLHTAIIGSEVNAEFKGKGNVALPEYIKAELK